MSELYNLELTPGQEGNGVFLPEFTKVEKFEGDSVCLLAIDALEGKKPKTRYAQKPVDAFSLPVSCQGIEEIFRGQA